MNNNDKIIDENELLSLIDGKQPSTFEINDVLQKAAELKGLTLAETAVLLNIEDDGYLEQLFETAALIKDAIYGNRLVLFAPLYVSNYCSNNCLYCGFRKDNHNIHRIKLTPEQIIQETQEILRQGHKRVLLLMGEHTEKSSINFLVNSIENVYAARDEKGSSIRRINIEIAPLTNDGFNIIKDISIGTYTVFQETYHRETYLKMHPDGMKSDYDFRLETMDRALSHGMHDVGIGALFGLFDYRFETLALLQHSKHLDQKFGVGPHTISIPRIKPASDAPASINVPYAVSDRNFKKLTAVIRCAVPYTGMILSTRETAQLRNEIFNLGVSQISAGSRTNPGGYKQAFSIEDSIGQFSLNDTRSSGEVIDDVISMGFIPSFCTACYRLGRVGGDFMDLAKPGLIKLNCHPNALLTLKEYLDDYADEKTKIHGEELIKRELANIPTDNRRKETLKKLERIAKGERDLYF